MVHLGGLEPTDRCLLCFSYYIAYTHTPDLINSFITYIDFVLFDLSHFCIKLTLLYTYNQNKALNSLYYVYCTFSIPNAY